VRRKRLLVSPFGKSLAISTNGSIRSESSRQPACPRLFTAAASYSRTRTRPNSVGGFAFRKIYFPDKIGVALKAKR